MFRPQGLFPAFHPSPRCFPSRGGREGAAVWNRVERRRAVSYEDRDLNLARIVLQFALLHTDSRWLANLLAANRMWQNSRSKFLRGIAKTVGFQFLSRTRAKLTCHTKRAPKRHTQDQCSRPSSLFPSVLDAVYKPAVSPMMIPPVPNLLILLSIFPICFQAKQNFCRRWKLYVIGKSGNRDRIEGKIV